MDISFFKNVLGRQVFLNICAALWIYFNCDLEVAMIKPLWSSRHIWPYFAKISATLAVPIRISFLNKITIRCIGRTGTRSYMKSKPVRFGNGLYAFVRWAPAYFHSFLENGSGNKTGQSPVQRRINLFRHLKGAVKRKMDERLMSKSSIFAFWCAQMVHRSQLHPAANFGRVAVMDNFYTHLVLACKLHVLSDGEYKVVWYC